MNWFRWYHGTVTDPKMALIAHKSGQPLSLVLSVWAYLLEIGSQSIPRGNINSFDAESLSVTLVTVTSHIEKIINAMQEKGMISDGNIGKWNMRQCDPTAAERQRKCRENKKNDVTPVTLVTVTPVTSRNVTPEEKRIEKKEPVVLLPDWLPPEVWKEYSDMRKKIKKPMTEYAAKLRISDLQKLKEDGQDPVAVLNQSTSNSWTDVYPLKNGVKAPQNSDQQRYN